MSRPVEVGSPLLGVDGRAMVEHVSEFQLEGKSGVGILEVSYCTDKERRYTPTW